MKFIKCFAFLVIYTLFFTNTFAEEADISIIDIDSSNSNILKIYFDKDLETNSVELSSDIKIFKDVDSKSIIRDLENDRLLTLTLLDPLLVNSSYSLLSVYGVNGSIDFNIGELINGLEVIGTDSDGIEKISIINSNELTILFKEPIISDDVDVKLLREYNIDSLQFNIDNNKELDIYLSDKLNNTSKYLVMMFSLTTKENIVYNIVNSIYDFSTDILSDENITEPIIEVIEEDKITDNVALNSAKTPNTGPETGILLLFTLILSSVIYIRRKQN